MALPSVGFPKMQDDDLTREIGKGDRFIRRCCQGKSRGLRTDRKTCDRRPRLEGERPCYTEQAEDTVH